MAYRARHKQERAVGDDAEQGVTEGKQAEVPPRVTDRKARRERQRTMIPDEQKGTAPVPDSVMRPSRVAFADQVRKQQPEGAAGYRLVLPTRSPVDTPKIVPVPDSQGGLRYWRIEPFDIPDDIRLQEGHFYRILWVDGSGQPLAPTTPYVPSLCFFLGPPDSEQDDQDAAYASILRDVRDPETRKKIEARIALRRLESQQQRNRNEELKQKLDRFERLHAIQSRRLDEKRRKEREDQAERERQQARREEQIAKAKVEQEQKDEREKWTALKVMGGIAAAVAVGWGPFVRFLDSLGPQPDAGRTIGSPPATPAANLPTTDLGSVAVPPAAPTPNQPAALASATPSSADTSSADTSIADTSIATPASTTPSSATPSSAIPVSTIPVSADTSSATPSSAADGEEAPIPVRVPADSPAPNQSSSETSAPDESLSDAQLQTLCRIIFDPERTKQVTYENACVAARILGSPPPSEPSLDLTPADKEEVREVLSSSLLSAALFSLIERFHEASAEGGEAMFALPPPFPSLKPQDRDRIHRAIATPDQRDYLLYLNQRQAAARQGLKPPPPRPTQVAEKEQKAIRRLLRDQRVMFYLSTIDLR